MIKNRFFGSAKLRLLAVLAAFTLAIAGLLFKNVSPMVAQDLAAASQELTLLLSVPATDEILDEATPTPTEADTGTATVAPTATAAPEETPVPSPTPTP